MLELQINDRIRTRNLRFFNNFKLNLKFDSVGSTFSFGQYFNPQNTEHKEMSCIGHYHTCRVKYNDELLLTGQTLSIAFKDGPSRQISNIGGYALPGVLADCNVATDYYPLQNDGLCLREIAQQLLKPFGLSMVIDASVKDKMEEKYNSATCEVSETIGSYLAKLATQKNIILSHNSSGALVFTRAKADLKPIAHFDNSGGKQLYNIAGTAISTGMSLSFDGQAMHSHITAVKEADTDNGNAGESTVRNPYVINNVFRPKVVKQSAGTDLDCEQFAKNIRAQELKGLRVTITTDRWLINGKVIKPNCIVSIKNPEIYLYNAANFFVEEVALVGDEKQTLATLTCVLPEVYNNQEPTYLFHGINLH